MTSCCVYCRMASNWDTVEVFVTSYGRDFTKEREVVAKQVIPDLEAWCETKKIQINVTEFKWVSVASYSRILHHNVNLTSLITQ